jgi:hypothetical protein
MRKLLLIVNPVLLLFISMAGFAQEILSGLEINHSVRTRYMEYPFLKSAGSIMLELPFFDDFSRSHVFPDPGKWSDRHVFINNDYPVNPVSAGVATFDVIDHKGAIYEHASIWPFIADQLTSRSINLSHLPGDSIYLSFFYQPQGMGDIPQVHDSLRLEFYSPLSGQWKVVWSVPGDSLHDFRLVMLPVTDPDYLREGFRFRFSNLATLADNRFNPGAMGNADHWHIDYVYLDQGRTGTDTIFRDVAFIRPLGSLLNNYTSMPWKHFHYGRAAEMGSQLPVTYRNNDNVTRTVGRQFSITSVYENTVVHNFSAGSAGIGPGVIFDFRPDLTYTFASTIADSALFKVMAWLITDNFDHKENDTLTYLQSFSNYFALDDGTAENGYGLFGGGTENARLAYRFTTYMPDSLRAVNIYFNQSLNNISRQYFHLAVWDDNNGRPGNLIYSQEGARPVYEDSLNRFHTYYLEDPVYVNQVFYAGLIQTTPEFLNIGWDANRDNSNRFFYNIHGEWKNTAFSGSPMIRPVVGRPLPHAPVKSYKKGGMNIYPNPAVDILYIDLEPGIERGLVRYKLFNRHGQMVYHGTGNNNSIELSSFPPGIYFLQAGFGSAIIETKKILITH